MLAVDMQTRLAPHVADTANVTRHVLTLLRAARLLAIPATVSEHCPAGLGRTLPAVRESLPEGAAVLEKISFSCCRQPALATRLRDMRRDGRGQVALCGMEAHVCVMQTGLDLLADDFDVYLVVDAIGSRDPACKTAAVDRLARAGAAVVTTEMLIFEWAERADHPAFRQLLSLVK